MKINVTVDLSEFYTEGQENSFSEEIKCEISARVKNQIWKDFEEKGLSQMKELIKHEFEKQKAKQLEKIVKKVISSEKIKKSDYSSELVTLEEYLIENLKGNYFSERSTAEKVMRNYVVDFETKFNKEVKQSSEDIAKELRDRYDLLFASQIVTKLNENGMLKTDVAKLLLNSENEG